MRKQYGDKKGQAVYYSWINKNKLDDSKPLPKDFHEHVQLLTPLIVTESLLDKPLKIHGIAIAAGVSRNDMIYLPEVLQTLADGLVGAPIYIEHVRVGDAIGKVTKTEFDREAEIVFFDGEIYDADNADKLRKGLIQHVSVGYDYTIADSFLVDGNLVPLDMQEPELSLVAVPGVPEANVSVMERMQEALLRHSQAKEEKKRLSVEETIIESVKPLITEAVDRLDSKVRMDFQESLEAQKREFQEAEKRLVAIEERLKKVGELEESSRKLNDDFQATKVGLSKSVESVAEALKAVPSTIQVAADKIQEKVKEVEALVGLANSRVDSLGEGLKAVPSSIQVAADKISEKVKEVETLAGLANSRVDNHLAEAVWTRRMIDSLPDSAFAVVLPGGKKDGESKTVPRSSRMLPHHGSGGDLDLAHLRNALARLPQAKISGEARAEAKKHLCGHAKEAGLSSDVCNVGESVGRDAISVAELAENLEDQLVGLTDCLEDVRSANLVFAEEFKAAKKQIETLGSGVESLQNQFEETKKVAESLRQPAISKEESKNQGPMGVVDPGEPEPFDLKTASLRECLGRRKSV